MSQSKDLSVAMIGAGSMAPEHIKAFNAIEGVKVKGITNRTLSKAEDLAKEFGIEYVCASIDELFSKTSADIAVMAVYETAILETAQTVLSKDWAVLMEKPIGLDFAEAQRVGAMAEKREKPVFVGLNRRHISSTLSALEDLNDHGAERFIQVQDQQSLETARIIGHADGVIKNWMYANSIHLVDYLLAFGRGQVEGVTVLEPWKGDNTERVLAHITFDSGDTAIYEAHWNAPAPWAVTVTTSQRRWELRPLERAKFQNSGERVLNDVDASQADQDFKPGFLVQADEVCKAVRGKKHNAVNCAEALRTTQLVSEIYNMK